MYTRIREVVKPSGARFTSHSNAKPDPAIPVFELPGHAIPVFEMPGPAIPVPNNAACRLLVGMIRSKLQA